MKAGSDGAAGAPWPGGPLDVVITSPFTWPWVRRGSERMLNDLVRFLVDRGHRVRVFSSGPEDAVEVRDGVEYHLIRQRFGARPRQFNCLHNFAFRLARELEGCRPDLVFSLNYFDAWAALTARRRTGAAYPVIFQSAGILSRRYFRAVPIDAWFFRRVFREASVTLAVSRFAGEVYRRDFGREAVVLPPPVMTGQFSPAPGAALPPAHPPEPRIVFVGDADERRKGARVLCRALPRVRERIPGARLVYAGRASDATRRALEEEAARLGTSDHVDFLGVGRVEDLPALLQGAAVTALPSVWEAFGMSLVESLAAGTPVVGTRQGGIVDIVDREAVGALFDPGDFGDEVANVDGLADAIVEVLERGKTPEVVAACRARAEDFSWAALGPVYERLVRDVVSPLARPAVAAAFPEPDPLLVSVVIPTHNRRALLARLLESLERQTLDPSRFEVHIVHNHTPDGTEEMARDWCARQPFRARYYRKNHNGPTRSRAFGAQASVGRFIAFVDDDCVVTPGWLEAGIAAFGPGAADPGPDPRPLAPGGIGLVQGRTLPMPGERPRFLTRTIRVERATDYFETCNIFYSRRDFVAVGGFSEDFLDQFSGEDADLGWKMTMRGYRAAFAPGALVHHEVFRVTYRQWLAEPLLLLKNMPYLAKKYPEFRRRLYHRHFFSKESCLFNLFLLGVAITAVNPIAGAVVAAPYLVERYRSGGHVGGAGVRIARVFFGMPRGLAMWWALLKGSIRARTILL
ncbi:MAG: glycosyltransferase [Burkholderiales bacterium]|nr:glycosyltransferase [Burkholderiales bacterium]